MNQIEKIRNSIDSFSSLPSLEEKVEFAVNLSLDFQNLINQNCEDENLDELKKDVLGCIEGCLYWVAARRSEEEYSSQLREAKERVKTCDSKRT